MSEALASQYTNHNKESGESGAARGEARWWSCIAPHARSMSGKRREWSGERRSKVVVMYCATCAFNERQAARVERREEKQGVVMYCAACAAFNKRHKRKKVPARLLGRAPYLIKRMFTVHDSRSPILVR